jgi:hypothetical protein
MTDTPILDTSIQRTSRMPCGELHGHRKALAVMNVLDRRGERTQIDRILDVLATQVRHLWQVAQ